MMVSTLKNWPTEASLANRQESMKTPPPASPHKVGQAGWTFQKASREYFTIYHFEPKFIKMSNMSKLDRYFFGTSRFLRPKKNFLVEILLMVQKSQNKTVNND